MYTLHDRIFGDLPAKNTVYTPYIHGSGQPLEYAICCTASPCLARGGTYFYTRAPYFALCTLLLFGKRRHLSLYKSTLLCTLHSVAFLARGGT
jgi:hypothetical protein